MLKSVPLAVSSILFAGVGGWEMATAPAPLGLMLGCSFAAVSAFTIAMRDGIRTTDVSPPAPPASRPPRPRTVVTKRLPVARELTREPDPEAMPDIDTVRPFHVPEFSNLPEFVRVESDHVLFASGDRVEFTLREWETGETSIEGIVSHVFDNDLGYKVVTDNGATYYPPFGCLTYVGDR